MILEVEWMSECETCLNSRPIISENGLHRVCCLSSKKAVDCITGKKKYYTRTPNKQQVEG